MKSSWKETRTSHKWMLTMSLTYFKIAFVQQYTATANPLFLLISHDQGTSPFGSQEQRLIWPMWRVIGITSLDQEFTFGRCTDSGDTMFSSGCFQVFCYALSCLWQGHYLCDCEDAWRCAKYLLMPDVFACSLRLVNRAQPGEQLCQPLYGFLHSVLFFCFFSLMSSPCILSISPFTIALLYKQQMENVGGSKWLQLNHQILHFTASSKAAVAERDIQYLCSLLI